MCLQLLAAFLVVVPPEAVLLPDVEVAVAVPGTETPEGVNVDAGVAFRHDCAAASAEAFDGGALEFTVAFPSKLH
jgi:hypothetical protein